MMDDRLEPVRDIADAYIEDVLMGTFFIEGEDPLEAHVRDLCRVLDLLERRVSLLTSPSVSFSYARWNFVGILWARVRDARHRVS